MYVLDGNGEPRHTVDVEEYLALRMNIEARRVKMTKLSGGMVSTVFLCDDHNWSGQGPPVLWETMVFGSGDGELGCRRYCTRAEASAGHEELVGLWSAALGGVPL